MTSAAARLLRVWDESWPGSLARVVWSPGARTTRPGEGLALVGLGALAAFSAWAFHLSGGGLARVTALVVGMGVAAADPVAGLYAVLVVLPFVPDWAALVLTAVLLLSTLLRRSGDAGRVLRQPAAAVRAVAGDLRSRLDRPVLLFAALLVVATVTSVAPAGSLRYLAIWGLALGLYWAVAGLAGRGDGTALVRVAATLGLTAVLAALYALYQLAVGVPVQAAWIDSALFPREGTRVFSFWGNPNVFALHLVLTGPLLAASLWTAGTRPARAGVGLAVLLAGLALVLTLSRGGWFALGVAVLFLGLLRDRRILVVGLLAAAAAALLAPEVVSWRAATLLRLDDPTAVHRIRVWEASARMAADFWYAGLGLSWRAFTAIYPQYSIGGRFAFHAHNHYLETLIELGVVGFIALHWLMVRPIGWAVRLARPARLTAPGVVLTATAAAILGSLAFGVGEPVFYLPRPILIAWAVLGLAAAARSATAPAGGTAGDRGLRTVPGNLVGGPATGGTPGP